MVNKKSNPRDALRSTALLALTLSATASLAVPVPGGTLDPTTIPKFAQPLIIPPEMPPVNVITDPVTGAVLKKEYRIGVREFRQQILPPVDANGNPTGLAPTPVWSYGPADSPWVTTGQPAGFNYPAFTIEALSNVPTQITWVNQLTAGPNGPYLPHLLTGAVDQTLHWANPNLGLCSDGTHRTDCEGTTDVPYDGPVPMSPHVHGAHVGPESDGYPEAWWLPAASDIPAGYATRGSKWGQMAGAPDVPGQATFIYPNTQRATTLWYHDHSLGMTRQNVYAGPAGFFLVRDQVEAGMGLPGPAPSIALDAQLQLKQAKIDAKIAKLQAKIAKLQAKGELGGIPELQVKIADLEATRKYAYREIPIVIQDRSFNADGTLFYPTDRAFFEGLAASQLQIPFEGQGATVAGQFPGNPNGDFAGFVSDIAPIWNPEAFFNVNVVNGRAWPYLDVAPMPYRFRLLNGANSRFYNLSLWIVDPVTGQVDTTNPANEVPIYQIGSDGGLLPNPVEILTGFKTPVVGALPLVKTPAAAAEEALLMAPAERADIVVDFTGLAPGTKVRMINTAPDAPFGGFPDVPADWGTTGQVMEFRVGAVSKNWVDNANQGYTVTQWDAQAMAAQFPVLTAATVRQVSLNEEESRNLCVDTDAAGGWLADANGNVSSWMPCNFVTAASFVPFAPKAALMGTQTAAPGTMGVGTPLLWMDNMTELPQLGTTEMWEIYNNTVDAHPIHEHLVMYQVVNREDPVTGVITPPEPNEVGWKDTVIAYPGQITRVIASYDVPGVFVFHCHILEHEDNEMMRPFCVIDPLNPDCNGVP